MATFSYTMLALFLIGLPLDSASNDVFVIDADITLYAFSCATSQLIALSADNKSLLFYDIEKNETTPSSISLPMPGLMFEVSAAEQYIAVAHDSYLSVVTRDSNKHTLKTYVSSVIKPSSIVIIERLICLIPAFDQWTQIQCLSMDTGNVSTCNYQIYAGSLAYANVMKGWVYAVDEGVEPQSMHKFSPSQKTRCLEFMHDNPDFGGDYYGDKLWFSYDGSRIFLENGETLFSADGSSDMKHHGSFNPSKNDVSYSYFSQSLKFPHIVSAIKSNSNRTVYHYSWPYLEEVGKVPVPEATGGKLIEAEEVHVCGETATTFVVAKYVFPGNKTRIGVVKRPLFDNEI